MIDFDEINFDEEAAKESLESWDELLEMLEEEDKEREKMMKDML